MSKLGVKMEVKKPMVSPDMIAYLEKNPALRKVLEKQANGETERRQELEDHTRYFLKLIHNHTHTVKDITDLPEYINSLNVLSVPAAQKLISDSVIPALNGHLNSLHQSHKKVISGLNDEMSEKLNGINEQLLSFQDGFKNFSPDIFNSIKNIIDKNSAVDIREEEPVFDPEVFRSQLIEDLKKQLKGSTKVIQINGGGLAAMPLNRIPGVNIPDPQDGQVLTYQASTKTWIAENSGGGGGETFLIQTTDEILDSSNKNTIFNNLGASTTTVFTIDAGNIQPGDYWELEVGQNTNGIQVVATGGMTIRIAGAVSSANGSVQCAQIGGTVKLIVVDASTIISRYSQKTWSAS